MKISRAAALQILQAEAANETQQPVSADWTGRIEDFSRVCEGTSKTHIAFLGTALLAKAVDLRADAFSVKAGDTAPGSYSARGLAHGVLVPHAAQLGINLGVTGREPLNNQPYFRVMRVSATMPVHGNAKPAIDALLPLLDAINAISSPNEAREALRAFIHVRRRYNPVYAALGDESLELSRADLIEVISRFVAENSEGGKRAQAVAAGLLDLFAGSERVLSGRINDPDRHLPGDVGIRRRDQPDQWEKVFEVRDKPVSPEDVYLFAQKAIENHAVEAAVLSVHGSQDPIDTAEILAWANARGVSVTFYKGWQAFVEQILFWSEESQSQGLILLPQLIHRRLIEIEVSAAGVERWTQYFSVD